MSAAAAAPPQDPAQFSAERFRANVAALVELGARAPGDEASAHARAWAKANAPAARADAVVALIAPLTASGDSSDGLADASSGAALILEAARALAARDAAPRVELFDSSALASAALAGTALAVYVPRACALPQRRDLLSHRVLRERFFDFAGAEAGAAGFEQSEAPHEALLAAGARRVVVLDAPRASGAACDPQKFVDALVRFVRDASALLTRGSAHGVNAPPAEASQPTDGAVAPQENS
ncbi:MAG: hypothetical protein FJ091_02210 [Deltaproteobacteria bacterium]|nr:hypothetical protein [Deltaproteobacteria bacterium]